MPRAAAQRRQAKVARAGPAGPPPKTGRARASAGAEVPVMAASLWRALTAAGVSTSSGVGSICTTSPGATAGNDPNMPAGQNRESQRAGARIEVGHVLT